MQRRQSVSGSGLPGDPYQSVLSSLNNEYLEKDRGFVQAAFLPIPHDIRVDFLKGVQGQQCHDVVGGIGLLFFVPKAAHPVSQSVKDHALAETFLYSRATNVHGNPSPSLFCVAVSITKSQSACLIFTVSITHAPAVSQSRMPSQ